MAMTEEDKRLEEAKTGKAPWRKFGPYLSERQWGTVREDYSPGGTAWEYLPHDHARSRAYRWGEDGIAGISDESQYMCFALCFWNGKDPILKERLFGLTGNEGNHGEDVKEIYFYLDNLPSHTYMKYLYKYPQNPYPYTDLVETNKKRSREQPEYELIDTGIFDKDEYFDIFIEYAKSDPEDILIRIRIENRGEKEASLDVLPTLWFRNVWSWKAGVKKPTIVLENEGSLRAHHPWLGQYRLLFTGADETLFTENETNMERLFNAKSASPFVKDAFHRYLIDGDKSAVNPARTGTKAAPLYRIKVLGKSGTTIELRLVKSTSSFEPDLVDQETLFKTRIKEADDFYSSITPFPLSEDMRRVQRQAFAGLLWNKQCYIYSVKDWLKGDPQQPKPPECREEGRNRHWPYFEIRDIFSMPDKWEYPWFASWDLAFHAVTLAMIDPEFAKSQMILLTREWTMAPNGQIPAYEWCFGDVNPPVQAWAAMRIYQIEAKRHGTKDCTFLERMFQKLLLNFTWWVNRKDAEGRNIFEGGFLGLDNIGAFDRSLAPPSGGILLQQDGTGWMGMYCLNMLQTALELATKDPVYEDMASKFFEHFVHIANAINDVAEEQEGLWDMEDGFYHSMLIQPDGKRILLRQDNMAGIIPLFAVATNDAYVPKEFPEFKKRFRWFADHKPEMLTNIADLTKLGQEGRVLLAFANQTKMTRTLKKILHPDEFLSPYGIRSVSKRHEKHPFTIELSGKKFFLDYEPAESTCGLFGGNSNWRGPVWFPLNYLLIESLQKFDHYYGCDFKVECPTGSGNMKSLWEVSQELTKRLISVFLKDKDGHRPIWGNCTKFQTDPHFRDYLFFHEYFHGDNGKGLGASNQTGWTAIVAKLICQLAEYNPKEVEQKKEFVH